MLRENGVRSTHVQVTNVQRFLSENVKGKDYLGNIYVDKNIILKWG
jgi:hypothetical protein